MAIDVQIISGPSVAKVSKEQAEEKLRSHPQFPKNASVELEQVEGRWVAAIASGVSDEEVLAAHAKNAKTAGPFPPAGDDSEPSGPPTDEAAPEEAPSEDEGPPKEEKPEGEKKDKPEGEKDEGAKIDHVLQLVTLITDALGLGAGPVDSPVPGPEDGPPAPPAGPPHGAPKPPAAGRPLKPGDAPNHPGVVPVGSPSFASVDPTHPWAEKFAAGEEAFIVEDVLSDDEPLAKAAAELKTLANPHGYKVEQLREGRDGQGRRTAQAKIVSRR